jgi:hypothetical protein
MSQENVEIVRQAFADFAGDATARGMLEQAVRGGFLAPDAELDFSAMYPDGPILRDGVVVRWKVYADRAEALEAAGLRDKR